jgi:hypothetical protein
MVVQVLGKEASFRTMLYMRRQTMLMT